VLIKKGDTMRIRLSLILIIIIIVSGAWIVSNVNLRRSKNLFLSQNQQKPEGSSVTWSEVLNQAIQEETKGNLEKARELYKKLVRDFVNSPRVGEWQNKVGDLNIKLLFSPAVTPGSIHYEIKSGDNLAKIAKKYNTTVELLKKSNNLSGDVIRVGRRLKVWTKPFNVVIDKSQNILFLKTDDEIFKTYTVSTGINNCTPTGNFNIVNKLVSPTWFKAGAIVPPESPDNILGSRWMGFDLEGYGIHGTTEEESLGKQITQGCIRMSNSDVEELFAILPTGTEVTIVD
jgi:lipoprotein-anchoring transpeptidase ErfK/SrfK